MSTDYRELRAEVNKAMTREGFKEKEISAYSPLDRWFGVEGINAPLGDPRFMPDRSLKSLERTYRRHLEDVADGLVGCVTDLSDHQVRANLREVERIRGLREDLRFTYLADERGTSDRLELEEAGGLRMLAEASRAGQEPLIRPSYKLALFMDWTRSLRGLRTLFDWPANASDDREGVAGAKTVS